MRSRSARGDLVDPVLGDDVVEHLEARFDEPRHDLRSRVVGAGAGDDAVGHDEHLRTREWHAHRVAAASGGGADRARGREWVGGAEHRAAGDQDVDARFGGRGRRGDVDPAVDLDLDVETTLVDLLAHDANLVEHFGDEA